VSITEARRTVPDGPSDATLIASVRRGNTDAYGVLYERHLVAAKRAAACLVTTPSEREDLVAEAFTRVLHTLRTGRGPDEEFRPYLLVTMRHLAINAARRAPSTALFADVPDAYLPPGDDPIMARLSSSDAANAFAGLPERWRVVLWHTEVEGESPAAIAPMLGMTPNSVAALAYRAREGLRQAYLKLHLPDAEQKECRATTNKLAGWVRHSISAPQRRKVSAHLDRCPRCRQVADGLKQVNGSLRAVLAPALLGTSFATAYATVTAAPAGVATGAVSWLSAVKAAVTAGTAQAAAAATIAVAAVTAVSSSPDSAQPQVALPPTVQHQGARPGTVAPGTASTSQPPASTTAVTAQPAAAGQPDPTKAGQPEAVATKKAAKDEAKATKQAEKAATKDAKKDAKAASKEANGKKK
jgi:RNA polymerase sigma factor (sigma-70 family)